MGNAMARRDQQQAFVPPVGRTNRVTEPEVRRSCVIVLSQHTKRQLADATDTTIEAARHWVDGTRTPALHTIINMARALPSVRMWLHEQIDMGNRAAQAGSDDAITEALVRLAKEGGLEEAMRLALRFQDKQEQRAVENDRASARRCEALACEIEDFEFGG